MMRERILGVLPVMLMCFAGAALAAEPLQVRVVDYDCRPAGPGQAHVSFVRDSQASAEFVATIDADGRFVSLVPDGAVALRVRVSGKDLGTVNVGDQALAGIEHFSHAQPLTLYMNREEDVLRDVFTHEYVFAINGEYPTVVPEYPNAPFALDEYDHVEDFYLKLLREPGKEETLVLRLVAPFGGFRQTTLPLPQKMQFPFEGYQRVLEIGIGNDKLDRGVFRHDFLVSSGHGARYGHLAVFYRYRSLENQLAAGETSARDDLLQVVTYFDAVLSTRPSLKTKNEWAHIKPVDLAVLKRRTCGDVWMRSPADEAGGRFTPVDGNVAITDDIRARAAELRHRARESARAR